MRSKAKTVALLSALALLAGCVAPGGDKTPDEVMASYERDARDIGEFGARAALIEDPTLKPKLAETAKRLRELPAGRVTADSVIDAVSSLPLEKLKSDRAQLYLAAGRLVLRRSGGEDVQLGELPDLRRIAVAFAEGIERTVPPQ